jgi:hypothetical protein
MKEVFDVAGHRDERGIEEEFCLKNRINLDVIPGNLQEAQ